MKRIVFFQYLGINEWVNSRRRLAFVHHIAIKHSISSSPNRQNPVLLQCVKSKYRPLKFYQSSENQTFQKFKININSHFWLKFTSIAEGICKTSILLVYPTSPRVSASREHWLWRAQCMMVWSPRTSTSQTAQTSTASKTCRDRCTMWPPLTNTGSILLHFKVPRGFFLQLCIFSGLSWFTA